MKIDYDSNVGISNKLKDRRDFCSDQKYLSYLEDILKNNNIADIKEYYHLDYVLSSKCSKKFGYVKNAAIFVHLYYLDILDECIKYLDKAINVCDVYITTSQEEICNRLHVHFKNMQMISCVNIKLIPNKGRDIAAMLVWDKAKILEYEYFCFIHDKKSIELNDVDNSYNWYRTLWDNTIYNDHYIYNVIDFLENEAHIGLLSVPQPFWGVFTHIFDNSWEKSYEDVCYWAKKLKLNCRLEKEKSPLTLGTAFWAKKDALIPLLDYNFNVSDFDAIGTSKNSYAIERLLGYVSQSQLMFTGIIQSDEYARIRSNALEKMLRMHVNYIENQWGKYSYSDLEKLNVSGNEIINSVKENEYNFIYGIDDYARVLCSRYTDVLNYVEAFLVNGERKEACFWGKRVLDISKIHISENSLVILAIPEEEHKKTKDFFEKMGIKKIIVFKG